MTKLSNVKPPYVSWATFVRNIDGMKANGIPPRFNSSTFDRKLSGALQSQLKLAYKYLGLIDSNDERLPAMQAFVEANDDERRVIMAQMLKDYYPALFSEDFNLADETAAKFSAIFKEAGVTGETSRKAESFFLKAAEYAGIPVSKWITEDRKKRGGRKKGSTSSKPNDNGNEKPGSDKPQGNSTNGKPDHAPPPSIDQFGIDPRYKRLIVIHEDLPKNGQWTSDERENWITTYTAFLDYLVKVVEEEYYE